MSEKSHADIVSIGFTGTQKGMTEDQRTGLKAVLQMMFRENAEFHHGDCIGADAEAAKMAYWLDFWVVTHPPKKIAKRAFVKEAHEVRAEKDYLPRNRDIVDETQILLAAPSGKERVRSGTWSTVRYARKKGRTILVVRPDGVIEDT